jgi:hypothetical protein
MILYFVVEQVLCVIDNSRNEGSLGSGIFLICIIVNTVRFCFVRLYDRYKPCYHITEL